MADSLLGLDGRTVLVIGAGPGIGSACAGVASRAGARVVALDFAQERATATARAITERGGEAVPYVANVLDDDQLRTAIGAVDEDFGGIDGVISVVGGSTWLPSLDLETSDFDHDYRLNLRYFFVPPRRLPGPRSPGTGVPRSPRSPRSTGSAAPRTTSATAPLRPA